MEDSPKPVLQRQTAYKVWINDIHKAGLEQDPDSGMSFLKIKDMNVVRANLFGVVADKGSYEGYSTIVLDDSSGSIRARVWSDDVYLLENVNVGDPVFVVARWAEFNNERYIRPEIVRKVSMDWALFRRLELTKLYGLPSREEKVSVKSEEDKADKIEPSLADREFVLNLIEKNDEVSDEQIVVQSGKSKEIMKVAIQDLLKDGEIFAVKPGVYRLV
jgi:RPA family protein